MRWLGLWRSAGNSGIRRDDILLVSRTQFCFVSLGSLDVEIVRLLLEVRFDADSGDKITVTRDLIARETFYGHFFGAPEFYY